MLFFAALNQNLAALRKTNKLSVSEALRWNSLRNLGGLVLLSAMTQANSVSLIDRTNNVFGDEGSHEDRRVDQNAVNKVTHLVKIMGNTINPRANYAAYLRLSASKYLMMRSRALARVSATFSTVGLHLPLARLSERVAS